MPNGFIFHYYPLGLYPVSKEQQRGIRHRRSCAGFYYQQLKVFKLVILVKRNDLLRTDFLIRPGQFLFPGVAKHF